MALNTLLVGLGNIGLYLDPKGIHGNSHAGAIFANQELNLRAGVDPVLENRRLFSERYQASSFERIESIPGNQHFDLIVLATPPKTHFELFSKVLGMKPSFIICEKPIFDGSPQGKDLLKKASILGIKVAVPHWMRYRESFIEIKQQLDQHRFGEIKHVRYLYAKGILNSGTHAIDLLQYLFGKVIGFEVVKSYPLDTGEINVDAILQMDSDIKVNLQSINYQDHFSTEIDIIGTKKRFLNFPKDSLYHVIDGYLQLDTQFSPCLLDKVLIPFYENLMDNFNNKKTILSSGDTALNAAEISRNIYLEAVGSADPKEPV